MIHIKDLISRWLKSKNLRLIGSIAFVFFCFPSQSFAFVGNDMGTLTPSAGYTDYLVYHNVSQNTYNRISYNTAEVTHTAYRISINDTEFVVGYGMYDYGSCDLTFANSGCWHMEMSNLYEHYIAKDDGSSPPIYSIQDWYFDAVNSSETWLDASGNIVLEPFGAGQSGGGGITVYNGSQYSLVVASPELNQDMWANVQPSDTFKVKMRYRVPADKYATTSYYGFVCPDKDVDVNECTPSGIGTIESIRNILSQQDNDNYVFFDDFPVVLNEPVWIRIYLVDTTLSPPKSIVVVYFVLVGNNDPLLPSANSATLEGGAVQDLGFWGNTFREMFVPQTGFMDSRFTEMQTTAQTHFPIFFELSDIVQGSTAGSTAVTIGGLNVGGSVMQPMTFFDQSTLNPATYAGVRAFLSMLMYVWLLYFVVARVPKIFSS